MKLPLAPLRTLVWCLWAEEASPLPLAPFCIPAAVSFVGQVHLRGGQSESCLKCGLSVSGALNASGVGSVNFLCGVICFSAL